MNLEQKVRKTVIVRRTPSAEVLEQVTRGNKFVIVEEEFDQNFVPQGYTLIDMKYKDDSFKALVPQSLLFYMANPGEGDLEDALDQISDFYGEAEDYEDDMIENGATSVQEANWATLARSAYGTYLINKLVTTKGDDDGAPDFDDETLKQLDLDDKYVAERVKAIAALTLGKNVGELKKYGIDSVLEHYGVKIDETSEIKNDEFYRITKKRFVNHWDKNTKTMRCLADSHYDLRPEFINDNEWDYDLRTMNKTRKVVSGFNAKIAEIEDEIEKYRKEKHGEVGRHDKNLLRQYANLAYIAKENPKAQLDVMPPAENDRSS